MEFQLLQISVRYICSCFNEIFYIVLLEVSGKITFWSTNSDDSVNSAFFCLSSERKIQSFVISRQTEYNEKGRRRLIVDAMNGDGLVTFYYILALICKTRISGVHEKKFRENTKKSIKLFSRKSSQPTVWKSAIKYDHDFYWKINIFPWNRRF